jgi:hypothetical protein
MEASERREKIVKRVEVACAVVGVAVILTNLLVKGVTLENALDATKDIVGFLVTIAVFVVAMEVYRKMTHKDFVGRFEALLKEWAHRNRFLINEKSAETERGKQGKRSYDMVVDPSSAVLAEKAASETRKLKGAFLYLPSREQMERLVSGRKSGTDDLSIEFRLNESTFITRRGSDEFTDRELELLAGRFAQRISDEFGATIQVSAEVSDTDKRVIVVDLKDIPRTEEAARRLVDMVDFVKTMVLALSKPGEDYLSALRS